jgi:hypothetical protein
VYAGIASGGASGQWGGGHLGFLVGPAGYFRYLVTCVKLPVERPAGCKRRILGLPLHQGEVHLTAVQTCPPAILAGLQCTLSSRNLPNKRVYMVVLAYDLDGFSGKFMPPTCGDS